MTAQHHDRIATRAYFAWLNAGCTGAPESHWFAAALAEHRLENEAGAAHKRREAARKGAATRRARVSRIGERSDRSGAVH